MNAATLFGAIGAIAAVAAILRGIQQDRRHRAELDEQKSRIDHAVDVDSFVAVNEERRRLIDGLRTDLAETRLALGEERKTTRREVAGLRTELEACEADKKEMRGEIHALKEQVAAIENRSHE